MTVLSDSEYLKRYNAIKLKTIRLKPRQCECCKNSFIREKMWCVERWGINKTTHTYYYCTSCMGSPEEVLNEIDTDANPFGIAWVDEQTIAKTDYTRMRAAMEKAFPEVIKQGISSNENNQATCEGGVNDGQTASTV